MLTKTEIDKLFNQKISKKEEEIYRKMAQAISDNNIKLFNAIVTQTHADNHHVTQEQLDQKWDSIMTLLDKIYGHVKKMDQEQTVMSHRITRLEEPSFSS